MNMLVIGGGLAAASAVDELRTLGYSQQITVVGAEHHLPYERPPLSKGLLLGTASLESVFVHDPEWYVDRDIDLRLGSQATRVDTARRQVVVDDATIRYQALLLATGSVPRRLPMLDGTEVPVFYLRTLEDSQALAAHLTGHVVIIGAGWIGLEVASAVRNAGGEATVIETAELPLLAVLGPELATMFADLHRDHGVDLRLSSGLAAVDGGSVILTDGSAPRPDAIVVGIGAAPSDQLAGAAGLATDNGILTDGALRSSDPNIWAAGDVANQDHPRYGRLRVEHWQNAIDQGRHAARAMMGDTTPYDGLPYFFSDQYDVGMEYLGHVGRDGYDDVVIRGDIAERLVTVLWTHRGTVVAGMHVNDWDAMDHLRRIVGRPVGPATTDPSIQLAELAQS